MSLLLGDVIDRHLNYVRGSYTRNTAHASEQTLRQFLSTTGNVQAKGLAPRHAERFQSQLLQQGMKPNTVNSRMSRLSAFSKWAVANRYIKAPIVTTVRTIPVPARPRLRVPATEFATLLEHAERPDHRITVALGLYMFLRAGEITTLRVRDVDLDEGTVSVVVHKTNDWDDMPICYELDQELRRWFVEYAKDLGRPLKGTDFLLPAHRGFTGWHGRPETGNFDPERSVQRPFHHVQRVLEKAGYPIIEDGKSNGEGCHTLRRSGARVLYDALIEGRIGGDLAARDDALRQVMSSLHHKSIQTTEHYIGLERDRQKRDKSIKGVRLLPELATGVTSIRREAL